MTDDGTFNKYDVLLCRQCGGEGVAHRPIRICTMCAGEGRNPIPLSEFYGRGEYSKATIDLFTRVIEALKIK